MGYMSIVIYCAFMLHYLYYENILTGFKNATLKFSTE